MKYYFHADTQHYKQRQKSLMITVNVPIIAVCVFCTVNIVLHLADEDKGIVALLFAIIVGSVAAGMICAFATAYFTEKLSRRHSRYTYFDILPDGMIYSEYAGEFVSGGRLEIFRRLYYIPFKGFEGAERGGKSAPCELTLRGDIREYFLPSRSLGYHVTETGETVFDMWELNERGYERRQTLAIKNTLGGTKQLEKSVAYYAEQFRERPEKKPFDISEHIAKKKRAHKTTSNPALEAPSFDRSWK
ncbi:MAG: hypothetical protein KIG62_04810 [Oscillospiraceae bacterium]|nr:hypothetical protein [Oscillospiraceae bacterium]